MPTSAVAPSSVLLRQASRRATRILLSGPGSSHVPRQNARSATAVANLVDASDLQPGGLGDPWAGQPVGEALADQCAQLGIGSVELDFSPGPLGGGSLDQRLGTHAVKYSALEKYLAIPLTGIIARYKVVDMNNLAATTTRGHVLPCRQCHFDVPIDVYRELHGYCGEECTQVASIKYRTR